MEEVVKGAVEGGISRAVKEVVGYSEESDSGAMKEVMEKAMEKTGEKSNGWSF